MQLYTLIAEYRGGTYISQTQGSTLAEAFSKWLKEGLVAIPPAAITELKSQMDRGDKLVEIQGLTNVWCISAEHARQLILVHMVATI